MPATSFVWTPPVTFTIVNDGPPAKKQRARKRDGGPAAGLDLYQAAAPDPLPAAGEDAAPDATAPDADDTAAARTPTRQPARGEGSAAAAVPPSTSAAAT